MSAWHSVTCVTCPVGLHFRRSSVAACWVSFRHRLVGPQRFGIHATAFRNGCPRPCNRAHDQVPALEEQALLDEASRAMISQKNELPVALMLEGFGGGNYALRRRLQLALDDRIAIVSFPRPLPGPRTLGDADSARFLQPRAAASFR